MNTETVYTIIQHIDKQLCKVELKKTNKCAIDHLFELRNDILLKYRPDPSLNWTFKNKELVIFFNKEVKWVNQ
jgi:hypothetical protein